MSPSCVCPLAPIQLRRYVRFAKTLQPHIPDESKRRMVSCFRSLRENDHLGRNRTAYRITVSRREKHGPVSL